MRKADGCSRTRGAARAKSIRVRRALIIMASASGTPVPAIARLVAADEDTVRDVIRAFNARAWARWTLSGREAVPAALGPAPRHAGSPESTHYARSPPSPLNDQQPET